MKSIQNANIKKLGNGITLVTINDPKSYNSLSTVTLKSLIKIFQKLDKDNSTKVIILEGAGNGFSAGHNLKEVKGLKKRSKYLSLFNLCSKLMMQIVNGKKPVIAKVHGAAYAAGCQLVASCDLAYSTNEAMFATPGVNIGLFCSTPMVAVSRKVNLDKKRVMDRTNKNTKRKKGDIGFSVTRGGEIAGEHTVSFIGINDRIDLVHKANNRTIFVSGAIEGAIFLSRKKNGLFDMSDLLKIK